MSARTTTSLAALMLSLAAASCGGSDGGTPDNQGDSSASDDTATSGDSASTTDGGGDTSAGGDTTATTDTTGIDTAGGTDTKPPSDTPATGSHIKTVFVILMENHSWSSITGSASATYINGTLVKSGASTKQYFNPPANHPSEPNYIWLEAGDNLGITNDSDPSANHKPTTDHLVTQLEAKGVTWKTYQEGIDGKKCPLTGTGHYAPKHNPFIYFDDVTDTNSATSAHCIAHVRPYTELAADLTAGKVAQYNFITPDLCNDMHGDTGCPADSIKTGDAWLAAEVPKILASAQYKDGGALFVTWDESSSGDGPIGMIVLSPLAKAGGYTNSIHYDHSSMVRTVEEIFGVTLLRGAKTATNLSDLFTSFP